MTLNIFYYVASTCNLTVNTGVQRVTRLLGRHLSMLTNFHLLANNFKPLTHQQLQNMANFNGVPYNDKKPNLNLWNKWLVVSDFFFGAPYYRDIFSLAKKNKMQILTIFYDDLHLKNSPDYFRSIAGSDIILSISDYSHGRLLYHFNKYNIKPSSKIIAPCKLPIEFPNSPRVSTYDLDDKKPYRILCVSLFERRKNQLSVIKAVDKLQSKYPVELLVVGGHVCNKEYMEEVNQLIANKPYIKLHLGVTDDVLKQFYLSSHLTVYPSTEEGYGLPIVESIWNCRPCICMNYGVMKETAVAGCAKIDCNNIDELAKTIDTLLTNKQERDKLITEIKNLKMKSWADYAKEIVDHMTKNSKKHHHGKDKEQKRSHHHHRKQSPKKLK